MALKGFLDFVEDMRELLFLFCGKPSRWLFCQFADDLNNVFVEVRVPGRL